MEHRKIYEENRTLNYINVNNLNLAENKEILKILHSCKTGEDKILFMTNYLENNIEITDIFSDLFYKDNMKILSDLEKYFLLVILSILDKNVMKNYFPNAKIKENNFIFCKENPLKMSQKLFQLFFSILFTSKDKEVQSTIISLLLNYSESSNDFVKYCIDDIRYMKKLFDLTYQNNIEIIIDIGLILDNILNFEDCDDDKLEEILKNIPLISRCKELISINNFTSTLKSTYLDVLYSIISKTDEENYKYLFTECIYIFTNILSTNQKSEEVFYLILKICDNLSTDEKICEEMIKTGLGYIFYNALSMPHLQSEYIVPLIKIFSNFFYSNEIILHFLNNYDGNILLIFIRIINTYLHTANDKDLKILKELLFCLSNFATGPPETQTIISRTDIPYLVTQIMKIKTDNNIYFEGIHFFYNILTDCNKETFTKISELHPFKLYAKGLEKTGSEENIELCLNGILHLIQKNNEVYGTVENLKNDFYICGAKRKVDSLCLHKNEKISEKSQIVLNYFDDKMKTD